jgi:hypothetical protein
VTASVLEAVRVTLVQILLQSQDIRLNAISSMYYVAPVCLVGLLVPFALLEAPKLFIRDDVDHLEAPYLTAVTSCFLAFGKMCVHD